MNLNKLKYILLILLVSTIVSCSNNKPISDSSQSTTSTNTKIFIEEFNSLENEDYLSAAFKEKYSIKTIDGLNYIPGIISIAPHFEQKKIDELGVKINSKNTDLFSILVPLKEVENLILIKGIRYFEITTKGSLK